jgi:hypothetical protein
VVPKGKYKTTAERQSAEGQLLSAADAEMNASMERARQNARDAGLEVDW